MPQDRPAGDGPRLDIIVPAYNEGENIVPVVRSLGRSVHTAFRVLICYDHDGDTTLTALAAHPTEGVEIVPVRNRGQGAFGAVVTGFAASTAPVVLVFPADDDYNAPRIDAMVRAFARGYDIVCASRLMRGGSMTGCPWLKYLLIRISAFALHRVARVPTHDPSNGLRFFSRRVIDTIPLDSTEGFTYSIEYLVKAHRLGWRIAELPAEWHQRVRGRSRFRAIRWLPGYLRWFRYAFATAFLRRGPETVRLVAATSAQ